MSITDAGELIKYIQAIVGVRSDELKIHSSNIIKIVDHLRSTGVIQNPN